MFFDRYKKSQFIVDVPMNESEIVYFNTRTNAVLVVNKEVGDRFALSTWTPSEKERWLAGGFLIECDFDEKKDLYEKFKEAKNAEGLSLIICPTLGCNLRCGYCYEGSQGEIELMNDAVADDIVEFVKKGGYKALTLTWYGGEPLLAADRVIGLQTRLNSVTKVVSSRELVDLSRTDPLDSILYSYIANFTHAIDDGMYLFD